jgi:hypothetical protein
MRDITWTELAAAASLVLIIMWILFKFHFV